MKKAAHFMNGRSGAVKSSIEEDNLDSWFRHGTDLFRYLLLHQKSFLLSLTVLVLLVPFVMNYTLGKPLLNGSESYYHLSLASQQHWFTGNYQFLLPMISYIPVLVLWLSSFLMGIATIILFLFVLEDLKVDNKISFFFALLIIVSPFFIFAFTTLSSSGFFLFLLSLGFFLLVKGGKARFFALFSFFFATFFDLYSTFILFLTLLLFFWSDFYQSEGGREELFKPNLKKEKFIFLAGVGVLFLIHLLILNQPFFLGPFYVQQFIPDLISDLGGLSGISFFVFLLFVIGISITWKNRSFGKIYFFLPVVFLGYYYSTQTVLITCVVILFFATVGLVHLLERKWLLQNVKKFTFLLLFLGILFSTLTYLNRLPFFGPSLDDERSLTWISKNTASEGIVFSDSLNADYITYFAQRKPFSFIRSNITVQNSTAAIFEAQYIQDLFPLLEQNNISIIYLNAQMKKTLPSEYGLLFLLKNERFKLVHSSGDSEVWMFLREGESQS